MLSTSKIIYTEKRFVYGYFTYTKNILFDDLMRIIYLKLFIMSNLNCRVGEDVNKNILKTLNLKTIIEYIIRTPMNRSCGYRRN